MDLRYPEVHSMSGACSHTLPQSALNDCLSTPGGCPHFSCSSLCAHDGVTHQATSPFGASNGCVLQCEQTVHFGKLFQVLISLDQQTKPQAAAASLLLTASRCCWSFSITLLWSCTCITTLWPHLMQAWFVDRSEHLWWKDFILPSKHWSELAQPLKMYLYTCFKTWSLWVNLPTVHTLTGILSSSLFLNLRDWGQVVDWGKYCVL